MAFLITSSVVSTGNSSSKDFPSGPLAYIIFVRWPCGPCDWASWGKPACHRARDTPEGGAGQRSTRQRVHSRFARGRQKPPHL
jgi:hypothetical protein